MPPRDRRPPPRPWVVIFILLSLLAHLLFVLTIVLLNHFLPKPELKSPPQTLSSTTLSLEQPPPTPHMAPPPKHIFMPTEPDAGAVHKQTPIESANDTRLKSQSTSARTPDSLMPDITSKVEHPANMRSSPNAPSTQPPHPAAASSQATQAQKSPPSPQNASQTTPHPDQATQQTSQPQPNAKPVKAPPAKTPASKVVQQQLDPNGLPVLPPLNAPTLAPASQQRQETAPASSLPEIAQSVHGALGTHGDTSAAAMATELGKYKAKVYAAVGSRWYKKVNDQFQVLPVGMVHIQFTVHSDGTVDTKVLEGDTGNLQMLLSISLNSIREAAPFDPFTPSMIQEVGDSYTDDFSFSIYGGGD